MGNQLLACIDCGRLRLVGYGKASAERCRACWKKSRRASAKPSLCARCGISVSFYAVCCRSCWCEIRPRSGKPKLESCARGHRMDGTRQSNGHQKCRECNAIRCAIYREVEYRVLIGLDYEDELARAFPGFDIGNAFRITRKRIGRVEAWQNARKRLHAARRLTRELGQGRASRAGPRWRLSPREVLELRGNSLP